MIDVILKMAMIHYQFESIHPFMMEMVGLGVFKYFILVLTNQIKLPILYLSKYINNTRDEYYSHLHNIRIDNKNIKDYLLYMVKGVEKLPSLQFLLLIILCH